MAKTQSRTVLSLLLALCLLAFSGCASTPKSGPESRQRSQQLEERLLALDSQIDPREAADLAQAAVDHTIGLAGEYEVVRPPWLHNVFVNNGYRNRGLCYDWTNDLFERLQILNLRTIDLHLAVARMDTRREHNALLVTAKGAPFESGLILDGWRHSGRLWFGPAATDKYPWVPLPADRVNPRLQGLMNRVQEDRPQ